MRFIAIAILLAVGVATASAQADANQVPRHAWEQAVRTMTDAETAEVFTLLWEYSTAALQVLAVAVGRVEGRDRLVLELFAEEWIAAKIGALDITGATAQELADLLEDFLAEALAKTTDNAG